MKFVGSAIVALVLGAALWLTATSSDVYVVKTGSMAPALEAGDAIVTQQQQQYRRGDVITFRLDSGAIITHRLVATAPALQTKGDANDEVDIWTVRSDQVLGAMARRIPFGGYVLVFLRQPAGIGFVALQAFSWVLAWKIFMTGSATGVAPATVPDRPLRGSRRSLRRSLAGVGAASAVAAVLSLAACAPSSGAFFSDAEPGVLHFDPLPAVIHPEPPNDPPGRGNKSAESSGAPAPVEDHAEPASDEPLAVPLTVPTVVAEDDAA